MLRHNRPDTCGRISLTPPVEFVEEADQGAQVVGPKAAPAGGQDEERIGALHVGPGGRQRAHPHLAGHPEEDPVLTPGVGVPDEFELLAEERVERMGHTESLRNLPITCS